MTIGEKIKIHRKKNDLTQEKLADYLRVSYQAVSKWETGISSPDLSMIAPLTKLLHISADELFGLNEPDHRRGELEAAYENTWKTGDLNERHKIAEEAVKEYPGEMKYLDWLAWTTAMRSFSFEDQETYVAEQEKAIKIFETIIENCTDDKIKKSAISGITQYLQFRGRKEEALKYAELYPEDGSLRKDEVLLNCLSSGDKRNHHIQKMLMNRLYSLLNRLDNFDTLKSRELEETIIKLFIPDENYLAFHDYLRYCFQKQAYYLTQETRYDEAINVIEKALYHARENDKIYAAKKIYKYTAPMFDMVEYDPTKLLRSGTSTSTEYFYEWTENKYLDPIRDRDDFKKLAEKK